MRPAHSRRRGAGVERPRPRLLVARREERAQPEQVVGAAHHAEQRALAEPEALEHLGPLGGVDDRRRLGLQLHAHADHLDVVAGVVELGARPAASTSGIVSSSSSPTLTTASTDRLVSRKYGASCSRCVGLEPGAVQRAAVATARRRRPAARRSRRRASCRAWTGACAWLRRFSTVSRSARASSISTTRRCSIGIGRPGDVVVVERPQHEHDGVDLADVGEELVAEALALARPLDEAADVDDLHRGVHDVLRLATSRPAGRAARRAPWRRRCWGPWWRTGTARPARRRR